MQEQNFDYQTNSSASSNIILKHHDYGMSEYKFKQNSLKELSFKGDEEDDCQLQNKELSRQRLSYIRRKDSQKYYSQYNHTSYNQSSKENYEVNCQKYEPTKNSKNSNFFSHQNKFKQRPFAGKNILKENIGLKSYYSSNKTQDEGLNSSSIPMDQKKIDSEKLEKKFRYSKPKRASFYPKVNYQQEHEKLKEKKLEEKKYFIQSDQSIWSFQNQFKTDDGSKTQITRTKTEVESKKTEILIPNNSKLTFEEKKIPNKECFVLKTPSVGIKKSNFLQNRQYKLSFGNKNKKTSLSKELLNPGSKQTDYSQIMGPDTCNSENSNFESFYLNRSQHSDLINLSNLKKPKDVLTSKYSSVEINSKFESENLTSNKKLPLFGGRKNFKLKSEYENLIYDTPDTGRVESINMKLITPKKINHIYNYRIEESLHEGKNEVDYDPIQDQMREKYIRKKNLIFFKSKSPIKTILFLSKKLVLLIQKNKNTLIYSIKTKKVVSLFTIKGSKNYIKN